MPTIEPDPTRPPIPEGKPAGSPEELEFQRAMQDYKRQSGRMFPTWSEVLEVARNLGYAKQE